MRCYYSNTIEKFLFESEDAILGTLVNASAFPLELTERHAWQTEIAILKNQLQLFEGKVFFEFAIPRMGKRIDVVVALDNTILLFEFKVGEEMFKQAAVDQVWDYALDLKNFHETSHLLPIVPVIVATGAASQTIKLIPSRHDDDVYEPLKIGGSQIAQTISAAIHEVNRRDSMIHEWAEGAYRPTPTIVEAALALYRGHTVSEIARSDADAVNLRFTVRAIQDVIKKSKEESRKSICFVTGVPGAGKTLVGLEIATENSDKESELRGVYLSGNGPLVKILQEALARDLVTRQGENNVRQTLADARRSVSSFVQNIHHFRNHYLSREHEVPFDHVAIFDEAQRAWNKDMTARFVRESHGISNFGMSESEYLISCMDRHEDWSVIVCLVGGGQEINRGEGGIREWLLSLAKSFPQWDIFCSPRLVGKNYVSETDYASFVEKLNVKQISDLHLATSMHSFRAAELSSMVNAILDIEPMAAKQYYEKIREKYPLVITRDLDKAKQWLKSKARGTERFGLVVSSSAERLRPHAIHVKSPVDPRHWFLSSKSDVRSSYYLEDVATEFLIQGLELDWVCVTWDADLRIGEDGWNHYKFSGNKWKQVHQKERKQYLENAYRVLMTRARQGMVLVVPQGSPDDATRKGSFYTPTYEYLKSIGLQGI